MKVQLFGYLGINEQGDLALYVSTGRLNPVGTRLEKGTPLPESALQTYEINYLHDTPEDAVSALQGLTKYLDNQAKEKKKMNTPYTGGGCLINHKDGIITISQYDETGYDNVIILNMDAAYDVAVFILKKYKPASKRHDD